jgi:hypothetical protein
MILHGDYSACCTRNQDPSFKIHKAHLCGLFFTESVQADFEGYEGAVSIAFVNHGW